MNILTFYDLSFRAMHAVPGRSSAAALPHWHSYSVRFWFVGAPDQDALSAQIEAEYLWLHGCDLSKALDFESTDERLAEKFLGDWAERGCVRICVTNDGRRGAEAEQ